jgi:hypothetical protein
MKKILTPIITVAILLFMYSCTHTTDDLFDKSASERAREAMTVAQQVLMGAQNGWLAEYYPERNQKYGGFNLYFKFNETTAIVRSEIDPTRSKETIYQMLSDRGPTVNFTEYNNILHYFSDPSLPVGGGRGLGYEGDYEFVVQKATAEEVILLGKKTLNKIRLTPYTGTSWESYCQSITNLQVKSILPLSMIVNENNLSINRNGGRYTITYGTERVEIGFIATPTGIKFYKPITIYGQTMQHFDIIEGKLVCTDVHATAEIDFIFLDYNILLGAYTLDYSTSNAVPINRNRSATITLVENIPGQTYHLKGILAAADEAQGTIVVKFTGGGIEIAGQIVFVRSGSPNKDFWWLPYSTPENGNYTTRSITAGMVSELTIDGGNVTGFTMVDNGIWGSYKCAGFMLRNYDVGASTGSVNVNGRDGQPYIFYPKFTKQ